MSKVESTIKTHWPSIAIAYLGLFSLGFLDNIRGVVFESMVIDFQISDSTGALFFSFSSLTAFTLSLLCQKWMAKWGSVFILRIGLVFMFLGVVGFAMAPNFFMTLAMAVVFGSGFGVVSVAQNIIVSGASGSGMMRRLFSGLHSMYALASLIAPLVGSLVFSLGHTWREVYLYGLGFPVLLFLMGSILKQSENLKPKPGGGKLIDVPKNVKRHIFYFSGTMSIYLISEISISSRLVQYMRRDLGVSESIAPLYLMGFFVGLFLGRFLFSFLKASWITTRGLINTSLLSSFIFLSLGLLVSPWFLMISGFTLAPFFPAAMDYITITFKEYSERALAYTMAFASLSVVFMHYGLGLVTDIMGLTAALWSAPLSSILVFGFFYLESKIFKA